MFPSGVYYLFALASSVAAKLPEAAVPTPGPMGPGETCNPSGICWTGQIHSPCNGATMGCTPDNTKVSYLFMYLCTSAVILTELKPSKYILSPPSLGVSQCVLTVSSAQVVCEEGGSQMIYYARCASCEYDDNCNVYCSF